MVGAKRVIKSIDKMTGSYFDEQRRKDLVSYIFHSQIDTSNTV